MRYLTYFFAGLGMLVFATWVLVKLFSLVFSGEFETKMELKAEHISPDKAFVARHIYFKSGGAAGSCNHVVTVESLLSQVDDEKKEKTDNRVLDANCGTWVSIDWTGPKELTIGYGFKRDAQVMMRKMSADKNISIQFEHQNEMTKGTL